MHLQSSFLSIFFYLFGDNYCTLLHSPFIAQTKDKLEVGKSSAAGVSARGRSSTSEWTQPGTAYVYAHVFDSHINSMVVDQYTDDLERRLSVMRADAVSPIMNSNGWLRLTVTHAGYLFCRIRATTRQATYVPPYPS